MRRIIYSACILISVLSCNTKSEPSSSEKKDSKAADTTSYPYKATYSSDITVPGRADYAKTVLTVWKMFETMQIDAMKQYYADTVTYEDASGMYFHGSSADLLKFAGDDIKDLDSLRFDISTWQSVHINDRNEDWVYIWAAERRYEKGGKADTTLIQEQWKVENNKVSYFNRYYSKLPKKH